MKLLMYLEQLLGTRCTGDQYNAMEGVESELLLERRVGRMWTAHICGDEEVDEMTKERA